MVRVFKSFFPDVPVKSLVIKVHPHSAKANVKGTSLNVGSFVPSSIRLRVKETNEAPLVRAQNGSRTLPIPFTQFNGLNLWWQISECPEESDTISPPHLPPASRNHKETERNRLRSAPLSERSTRHSHNRLWLRKYHPWWMDSFKFNVAFALTDDKH